MNDLKRRTRKTIVKRNLYLYEQCAVPATIGNLKHLGKLAIIIIVPCGLANYYLA